MPGISQRLLVQGQPPGSAGITTLLLPYLVRHSWPGNVRELENVIERAMLSASEIFHEHGVDEHYLARVLPELFEGQPQPRSRKEPSRTKDLHAIGKTAQLRYIQETLDSCQGSLDEAARRLGISRPRCGGGFVRHAEQNDAPGRCGTRPGLDAAGAVKLN